MIQITTNGIVEDEISKMGERTVQAIDLLIDNSLYIRKVSMAKSLQTFIKLSDFCTIKVMGARRTGHTTAIEIVSQRFKKAAVVVPLQQMTTHGYKLPVFSIDQVDHMRGLDLDAVFVDLASIMSGTQIKSLKAVCEGFLSQQPEFCLIMLS
jgi:predicted AAA+ superfamily ATPase